MKNSKWSAIIISILVFMVIFAGAIMLLPIDGFWQVFVALFFGIPLGNYIALKVTGINIQQTVFKKP